MHKTVEYQEWVLKTSGHELICADDHIVFLEDYSEVFVKDLRPGDKIHTEHGVESVISVKETDAHSHMFDLDVDSDDHRFYTDGILSHNSETVVAYFLWCVLFTEFEQIAICANIEKNAAALLGRLKRAYERLPMWLQQGVEEWNKRSIKLENGSEIMAFATSGDGIRSRSFTKILLDEFGVLKTNLAEEFMDATFPTISSGATTKIFVVSTPKGLNHFHKMWIKAEKRESQFVPMQIPWNAVPGRDDAWREREISNIGPVKFAQEYSCVSGDTLIETENGLMTIQELWEEYNADGL